jgi:O-antigen/teichoic acid export membrane protein
LLNALFNHLSEAFGRAGMVRNAIALSYSAACRVVIQLVAVPVFTYFWGLHDYGTWLLLFTLPSFIMMGDIGLNFAASTAMIAAIERGEAQQAADTFSVLRRTVVLLAVGVFTFAGVLLLLRPQTVDFANAATDGRAVATVVLIVAYALIGVQNTSTLAGFRSTGDYAKGVLLIETAGIVESIAVLVVVAMGGNPFHAALTYFAIRASFSIFAAVRLRVHAPELFAKRLRPAREVLKGLIGPAVAGSAVPISHALTLQGSLAVLGAVAGPASVAVFATSRTLVRLPFQLMMIVVNATLPLFTAAAARGDEARKEALVNRTLAGATLILVPFMLLIAFAGEWIVKLWTNGVVEPMPLTVVLLVIAGLLNGGWLVLCNFVMALNRQAMFSYFYLAASLVMLGATAAFAYWWGRPGAALAALLLDAVMLAWVLRAARRLDIVNRATLRGLLRGEQLREGLRAAREKFGR